MVPKRNESAVSKGHKFMINRVVDIVDIFYVDYSVDHEFVLLADSKFHSFWTMFMSTGWLLLLIFKMSTFLSPQQYCSVHQCKMSCWEMMVVAVPRGAIAIRLQCSESAVLV